MTAGRSRRTLGRTMARGLLLIAGGLVLLWSTWWLWPANAGIPDDQSSSYLDMHVHVAGLGADGSGCFVSEQMRSNFRFPFLIRAMGTSVHELEREGDQILVQRLSEKLAQSRRVGRAVLLAMDGVVDASGNLDRDRTIFHVPNDYLAEAIEPYPNLLLGASINPYRHDALERLDRVHAQGAVLVKWIPAIMEIDPADPALVPFYQRLKELDIPLLSHAGQERSFPAARDELGDPRRLELPLSLGVTVIAAHVATTGEYEGETSFERLLPMFVQYPKLYAEISSLTQVNKRNYLSRALAVPGLEDRLLYGSDWPLQFFPLVHPLYAWPALGIGEARAIADIDHPWDRDVAIKSATGVSAEIFERSALLLERRPAQ